MKRSFLLLSLFILAAKSNSSQTNIYPGSIENSPIVKRGNASIALPSSMGTNVLDIAGFVFPSWTEIGLTETNIVNTAQYIQTNVYDMVIQWDAVIRSKVYNGAFVTYSGRFDESRFNSSLLDGFIQTDDKIRAQHPDAMRPHLDNGLKHAWGYISTYTPGLKDISIDHENASGIITASYSNDVGQSSMIEEATLTAEYTPTYLGYVTNSLRVAGLGGCYYGDMGGIYEGSRLNNDQLITAYGPTNWTFPSTSLFNPLNERMSTMDQSTSTVAWIGIPTNEASYTVVSGEPENGTWTNIITDFWTQLPITNVYKGVRIAQTNNQDYIRVNIDAGTLDEKVAYYLYGSNVNTPGYSQNNNGGVGVEGYYKGRNRGAGTLQTGYVGVGTTNSTYIEIKSQPPQPLLTGGYSDPSDNIVTWLALVQPDPRKRVFMDQSLNPTSYTRNTNCWLYGLDLTPFSPWNSSLSTDRGGALISPRHYLCASHWPITNGKEIWFVTQDNQLVKRTVVSGKKVYANRLNDGVGNDLQRALWVSCPTDLYILLLDSDVPSTISHCKVLPPDYRRWLPGGLVGVPCVWLDKVDYATATMGGSFDGAGNYAPCTRQGYIEIGKDMPNFGPTEYPDPNEPQWEDAVSNLKYHTAVDRDSGNPFFTFINNDPVLIGCFQSSAGNQYGIHEIYDDVNKTMNELGGGYQLDPVDLGALGFPEYKLTEER